MTATSPDPCSEVADEAVDAALAAVAPWYRRHARESVQIYPPRALVSVMLESAAPSIRGGGGDG